MKKSESGNYTVYEGSDPNSLHDYSQTIAKELENRDRQFEEEQGNQNTNIELLQKENEEIKEENSRLKEDLNAFPTTSGSGEYVILDTADSRFKDFKVLGKSEQETRSGKNHINPFEVYSAGQSVTNNGVTFTIQKDGKIKVNGTATGGRATCTIQSKAMDLLAEDYVLSQGSNNIQIEVKVGSSYYKTAGDSTKFSLTEVTKLNYAALIVNEGLTVNNEIVYAQLEKGTIATEYEQYGAMPSTSFLSKTRNVGDNINIFNKNAKFNGYNAKSTVLETGIRVTATAAGTYNNVNAFLGAEELLGKTITINSDILKSSNASAGIILYFGKNGSPSSGGVIQNIITSVTPGKGIFKIPSTFPDDSTGIYIFLYCTFSGSSIVGDYVDYNNLKAEIGETHTSYSSYNSGNLCINVQGKNLYNSNYKDYIRPVEYYVCPITLKKGKKYSISSRLVGTAMSNIVVGIAPYGDRYSEFSRVLVITVGSSSVLTNKTFTVDDTWTSPKLVVYVTRWFSRAFKKCF